MYHTPAASLLEAIRQDRGVQTAVSRTTFPDGDPGWIAVAQAADGQVWRSIHSDQMLAVVMLERLLRTTQCPLQQR